MGNDLLGAQMLSSTNIIRLPWHRPKKTRYDESAVKSPGSTNVPGVELLDVMPDKIDIDERLASVLGHERAIASATDPSKGVAVR